MKTALSIILLGFAFQLFAQTVHDSIVLKAVEVRSSISDFPKLMPLICLDSLMKATEKLNGLQYFLNKYTGAFIKEYSPGGLTTSSQRGFGASQTRVLWNGFEVNSVSLGQMDYSGTSIMHTSSMTLLSGSYSALEGFGGSASTLLLNSDQFGIGRRGMWLINEVGNIGLFSIAIGGHSIIKNLAVSGAIDFRKNANRYAYSDNSSGIRPFDLVIRKQAEYSSLNATANAHYSLRKGWLISSALWITKNNNLIPVSLLETEPDTATNQQTNAFRLIAKLQKQWQNGQMSNAFYFASDDYNYVNTSAVAESNVNSQSTAFRSKLNWSIGKKIKLNFGLSLKHIKVRSNNYSKIRDLNSAEMSAQASLNDKRFQPFMQFNASIRESFRSFVGPVFGIGKKFCKEKLIVAIASASNFRYPSFNDLYWQPGGNPDLLPEEVHTIDVSFEFKIKHKNLQYNVCVLPYYAISKNLIQWIPAGAIWTPVNILKTKHLGVEGRLFTSLNINNWTIIGTGVVAYCFAQDFTSNDSERFKKDLIYIPRLKANASLEFNRKQWSVSYSSMMIGKRYTDVLNARYMPVIYIHNLDVGYLMDFKKMSFQFSLVVENIMNADYQIVAWYPMPQRWFHFRIKGDWHE